MSEVNNLPKGWRRVGLDELCDKLSLNKIKIKQKDYLSEGKYPVVDQGQELIGGYYNNEKFIVPNEPPFIIFGDHTKVKKYIPFKFIAGADGVKVLTAKAGINPKFLFYSLFTIKIEDKGYARHFQLLEKELFPLPPNKQTQDAIVSKIEELFSELDNGIENLRTAQQQLKTYRQSVLKWAFEGKLTVGLVGHGGLPGASPVSQKSHENANGSLITGGVNDLPEGWKWVKLGEVMESVRNGYSKKPDDNGQNKILRISSVRPNSVDFTDVRFLETSIGPENEIREDDLLFTRYYGEARKYVLSRIKTTAGQTGIAGSEIKQIPIPLAPVQEQTAVVEAIESRLSVADKLEETISQSLQQAEALRQSILKRAFEGRLVN
jgi:type I restriction enzyme S subunit